MILQYDVNGKHQGKFRNLIRYVARETYRMLFWDGDDGIL